MTITTVYADIVKAERNENGDLVVVGKATGPDLDLDQQICDPVWLGKAMPEWFSTGANIREQHSTIAAGVGTEMAQDGDSWMVTSLVVDKGSAEKVEKKVLKGYSIGISNPRVIKDAAAPGGRIVDGQIVEVSLVDRPCNPTALLSLAKAAKPGATMKAFAFDAERMLVKVEDFEERPDDREAGATKAAEPEPVDAKAIVARYKASHPDVVKASPAQDIAGAQAAIAAIAQLIISEAGDLATGDLGEACDIQDLLCAIDALRWFICGEAAEAADEAVEDEPDEAVTITIPLSAEPDSPKSPEPAATKADGPDLTELVKQAVAEAMKDSQERVKALESELAKVSALPRPGGPVLTRTAGDTEKAAARDELVAEVAKYRALAGEITDPLTRDGYLKLAAAAELKLK
ncbi:MULTISPECIES: hypothetical protein [Amycolatopsis]|uniref:Capsid maturation protease n=1 Tax=Amycolatopsis albidoflavus TaxID=102226 RepID=A0ABW5I4B1_9PSEU